MLEQTQRIPDGYRFEDFAIGDFVDGNAADGDLFVGGRDAEEFAFVRAGDGPGDHQLVFFADSVVNRETKIGETGQEALRLAPVRFGADRGAGKSGISEGVTFGDDLFEQLEFAIVPDVLIEAAEDVFVSLSNGHIASPEKEFAWVRGDPALQFGQDCRNGEQGWAEPTPMGGGNAMPEVASAHAVRNKAGLYFAFVIPCVCERHPML